MNIQSPFSHIHADKKSGEVSYLQKKVGDLFWKSSKELWHHISMCDKCWLYLSQKALDHNARTTAGGQSACMFCCRVKGSTALLSNQTDVLIRQHFLSHLMKNMSYKKLQKFKELRGNHAKHMKSCILQLQTRGVFPSFFFSLFVHWSN